MAVEHYTRITHTACIHINSHPYAQTLLTMIPTSVGEVAVALSLNAVGGHWGQQGCPCGGGGLTCAAETGRLRTRSSRGVGLLRRGAPGGLMGSRRRQVAGRGPERRSSRDGRHA